MQLADERAGGVIDVEERLLLQRHLRGDEQAFTEIVGRVGGPIWSLLGRAGLRDADRDDLYQEVLWRVHRGAHTYRPDRALKPWVLTIATNAVRDHWRRRRVEALVRGRPDEGPERPVPATAHADLEGRQAADWMTEQIAALPQAQREVVELCCLQGLAQTDVAAALGLPVNTVKTHLRRGRLRLAEALGRRRAVLQREAP